MGDTLTVADPVAGQTLNPAMNAGNSWLVELAYEPLIKLRPDGGLAPGLATSWSYEGDKNTTFVLHLRPRVTFSDGSALTAQGVVENLRYFAKTGALASAFAGDTFTATAPLTVTIKMKDPNPDLPLLLTQAFGMGSVISPKGLSKPSVLGTATLGAGPYKIDPAQTVAGDHYTYVPNPRYDDRAAVHWRKVIVKIIQNPQSTLNALRTGQVDVSLGDPSTTQAAKTAGLDVVSSPSLWTGVVLADRTGKLTKALGDVRVRQALNYATDRTAIAGALYRGLGTATSQITVPGGYGYDASLNSVYAFDVNKAKRLLAEAGYSHGFSLAMVTSESQQQNLVAQALARQWKNIGVTVRITDHANENQYTADAFGGKFPTFMTAFGQLPVWLEGPILFRAAAVFNPLHTSDPELDRLYSQAAASSGTQKTQLDQQIQAFFVRQAWYVPVVATGLSYYVRKTIAGAQTSAQAAKLTLAYLRPAS